MTKQMTTLIALLAALAIFGGCGGENQPVAVQKNIEAVAPVVQATPGSMEAAAALEPPKTVAVDDGLVPTSRSEAAPVSRSPGRYGLVSGPIGDGGFNQLAWYGLQRAAQELGIQVQQPETQSSDDAGQSINALLAQGVDGIVAVGFELAPAVKTASEANPNLPFVGVDFPSQTTGDMGLLFAADEAAFMAGYLAAGMSQSDIVCTYGGRPIPSVLMFMVGFENGVTYHNATHGRSVQVLGWQTEPNTPIGGSGMFIETFTDTAAGQVVAESFFAQGCDIIFPVAGAAGLGTAAAAQAQGLLVIGVDADQTKTAPQYGDVYLTSVLKNIDVAVFETITRIERGDAAGRAGSYRNNYIGNLANGGVGLAPFHNLDDQIPQQLKDDLAQIRERVIEGSLPTGWPISQTPDAAIALSASGGELSDSAASLPADEITFGPAPEARLYPGSLTPEMLQNAMYRSQWTASGSAPLSNGQYREAIAPGAAAEIVVQATEFVAFGDITHNGLDDAALVLVTNPGGSGAFFELVVLANHTGRPEQITSITLGDRVQIQGLAIEDGEIVVSLVAHGPSDPPCCPTQPLTRRFAIQSMLIETESRDSALGTQ